MGLSINKKRPAKSRTASRSRRHIRLRKRVVGSAERPRLVVTRSSRHVFVQVVDDTKGMTLVSASTLEADLRAFEGDKTAKAKRVGELIASVPRPPVWSPSCSTAAGTSTTAALLRSQTAPGKAGWHCDRREQREGQCV